MKTCYIIDGEKERPHDNIPEKCLQTIDDSKIVFSYIKNDNKRGCTENDRCILFSCG